MYVYRNYKIFIASVYLIKNYLFIANVYLIKNY